MQIHIFFFTIWIRKRKYTQEDAEREKHFQDCVERKRALDVKHYFHY
ncbi:hypothetical protein CR203_13645 [Salipaludibacillus neizhouensis]|uniref:YrzI family protein n=1 Tax=Salipaludibacillus neizhouensis TaxID=885475 RepID=A0A3A9K3C6_9BACI|nr:YrzI family small protein [Salipaludibacillus neizhouensis]RKL66869.1 hypothetical protein CR203_13645 [Salipaludibacillus neizhouensis]